MPAAQVLRREVRVALSRRAQPLWFRILKWIVALAITAALWRTGYVWLWIGGALALGLTLHLFWRWKTRGWTRAWFGWNDIDTASRQ